jgi:tetratricopeptide (TPR) repeat protein
MRTPFFEDLCAEIRGIDLGDDTLLSDRLAARVRESPESVDHEAWLLLAVLRARDDDAAGALEALAQARAGGGPVATIEFLRAHLLVERGDPAAASAALDAATADADDSVAPADIEHARGALAWASGDLPTALHHFRAALQDDPHDAPRWLQTGRALAEAQRWDEAERAFSHAIAEDEEQDDARYERAALWLSCRRLDDATAELAALAERVPAMRERARVDPRWRGARTDPAVAAVLSPAPRTPTWIPEAPPWLPALARDPGVAQLGVEWVDAEQAASITARIAAAHERRATGTMHTPATLAFANECRADTLVVARGPTIIGRDRRTTAMVWLLDRRRDCLRLAPSESYPAFLWIPAGRDVAGMTAALAPFVPQPSPPRVELSARVRGFLGYRLQFGVPSPYTGELEPANAAELDRHFAVNPFVEPGAWGSSRADDPWPEEMPAQPNLQLRMAAREQVVTLQTPGRVWSIARRTCHSRSILTIELHHRDLFVADVRYRPSPHTEVLAALNARFGSDYPTDLPIDVVAALLGFRFDGAADLEARLADAEASGELVAGLLQVTSALRHDDLSVTALYRRWVEHPDPQVRSALYNIFVAHNHESLLEEACVTEPDAEIRAQIEAILDDGIAVVQWDPYRDYSTTDDDTAAGGAR